MTPAHAEAEKNIKTVTVGKCNELFSAGTTLRVVPLISARSVMKTGIMSVKIKIERVIPRAYLR